MLTGMPDMPFGRDKKLDVAKLLGLDSKEPEQKRNPIDAHKRNKLIQYYKGLHYTDAQIDDVLNKIEGAETVVSKDRNPQNNDGKINLNDLSDAELQKMSKSQLDEMKKSGKVMSQEEAQSEAFDSSKDILQQKINADKERYGNTYADNTSKIGAKYYKDDLSALLKEVNDKVKDFE